MKLGIGLIIIGTIFLWDGVIHLVLGMTAPLTFGAISKLIIGWIMLFFGTKRVYSKRQLKGSKS